MKWIANELSPLVTVSIMSQYFPRHKAPDMPPLARTINATEHRRVVNILDVLGLENGWMQEAGSQEFYLPDFNTEGHPFERG
jgi:putative pyruvate formate lyase activating enzyme